MERYCTKHDDSDKKDYGKSSDSDEKGYTNVKLDFKDMDKGEEAAPKTLPAPPPNTREMKGIRCAQVEYASVSNFTPTANSTASAGTVAIPSSPPIELTLASHHEAMKPR